MKEKNNYDLLAVVGPTASGKTAISIELARRLKGEIISADSMAVYKKMNVGTAKPDECEQKLAKFHLIDVAEPTELYNVGIFEKQAAEAVDDILSRGHLPIICGGSGLYVQAAISGLQSEVPQSEPEIRQMIERVYKRKGLDFICEFLRKTDSEIYSKTDLQNPRRVCRMLEIYKQTGKPASEVFKIANEREIKYKTLTFGLYMSRSLLHERINKRVEQMLENGLEQEVKDLLKEGSPTALQAIGYKEMSDYVKGECSLKEAAERIKAATRQLAKRQCSWFKRDKNIIWIDIENMTLDESVDFIVRRFEDEIKL